MTKCDKIMKLKAENKRLKEKAKNIVIPKFQKGKKVWFINSQREIHSGRVVDIKILNIGIFYTVEYGDFYIECVSENNVFRTKAKAEITCGIELCRYCNKYEYSIAILKINDEELKKRISYLENQVVELKSKNPQYEFKVGDRVQFKSWEEMEQEFGLNEFGDIGNDCGFIREMEYLCETYATIKEIDGKDVKLKDFTVECDTDWSFGFDMLKPATDEPKCKFKVGDKVKCKYDNLLVTIIEITQDPTGYVIRSYDGARRWVYEKELEPYTEPRWTFTDDEKVILRNLPKVFKWIARDDANNLIAYSEKPKKGEVFWVFYGGRIKDLDENMFQSIKWTDEEPCEFRKYI